MDPATERCPACGRPLPRRGGTGRPPGRPPKITEQQRRSIVSLREAPPSVDGRPTWREISRTVGLPPGTCSWVYSRWKSGKSRSENAPGELPALAAIP